MKSNFYSIFIFFFLISCNYFNQGNESKILEETKKYTENYFFKNNYKVEMIDFKLNSYKEIDIKETDSLISRFMKNKLLTVAIKLSNQKTEDFFAMDSMWQENFIDKAAITDECKMYAQDLKKNMGQKGYEVHIYSKYVTMDMNGNNQSNHLLEDRTYLLNKDFLVLGIIK
jgi:hypothetical protein